MGVHPSLLLAHGVAVRADLPLPFALVLIGSALVLLLSFVALGSLWTEPRLRGREAGRPLPPAVAGVLEAPELAWGLRVLGLLVAGYVAVALFLGPDDDANPAAGALYVLLWVGVVGFASALLGPVWRALNPLRSLHLLASRAIRRDPHAGLLRYSSRLGRWPAAVTLTSFAWLELAAPNRASVPVLQTFLVAYAVMVLGGAVMFGSTWFAHADGFEVASTLFGHLSVVGRRGDGVLVLRSPLDGVAGIRGEAGLAAVVSVLLGSTFYDGVSGTTAWIRFAQGGALPRVLVDSVGLLLTIGAVGAVWTAATVASGRLARYPSRRTLPGSFAHSVVPIALGYLVAHYWSLLVVGGQLTLHRLSDPLVNGSDLLGTGGESISYAWVQPSLVAALQVASIVTGHLVGVVLAHDRSVALFKRRRAVVGQLPVVAAMVAFTVTGLVLLFSG